MKIQSATPVPESGTEQLNYPTPQKLFTIEEITAHIKNTPCPTSGSAPYFTEAQWKYAKNRFLNTVFAIAGQNENNLTMKTDTELLNWIEENRPNIFPIAKPFDGNGEVEISHWELEFGLHSVCRPTLREAIIASIGD